MPIRSLRGALYWLANQPYLLLSVTSLFWAGNAIVGRLAAGHIPPVTMAFVRWSGAFLIVLPFAWSHLRCDWPAIRGRLGLMLLLSLSGIGAFNTLQYLALERTTALNVLLLQSAMPLFVGTWSLVLLGTRLSLVQMVGIGTSLIGVLVILLKGNLLALASLTLNGGDLIFIVALVIFGFYSAMSSRSPKIAPISFLAFTFGVGALSLMPFVGWEFMMRPPMEITARTFLSLGYIILFPSILAYLCYNRGVALIGGNRSAPFFHLVPVFGSAMAILLLGERAEWFHALGYVLVLCGIAAASRKQKADVV
jgi:drug/metabolite transporter (DMT)-like permease